MLNSKIKEIEEYKEKIAQLEEAIEAERRAQLMNLHAELGYQNPQKLIEALQEATRASRKGKRTVISEELRDQIKQALLAGNSGAATAREFGVSVPTIQNIKKELGLVKKG